MKKIVSHRDCSLGVDDQPRCSKTPLMIEHKIPTPTGGASMTRVHACDPVVAEQYADKKCKSAAVCAQV